MILNRDYFLWKLKINSEVNCTKNENNEMNNLYEEGALKIQKLTFAEVVFAVVECGLGSGALGTAYSARLGGFPIITFWLVVSGILTLISMYYVAEATLRTKK